LTINVKPSRSRMYLKIFLTISLLSLFAISTLSSVVHAEPGKAYLFMTPPMYVAKETGEVFNVAVNISNVENLHSVEFAVSYNTSLLDVDHVTQGAFFPLPPRSRFDFEKNVSLGSVKVKMSLADLEAPRSGDGDLAVISFKVVQGPLTPCASCPLFLGQILLLNSALTPINHDSVGAMYFWKSMQPDPPLGGRLLDLYTQKGGKGPNEPGGEFVAGEMVYLISRVTYNDYPVQQKLVVFEVRSPLNETVVILVAATDQDGFAQISFRIPNIPSSNGTWTGISVVDIAGETVWDTINFRVYLSLSASISPLSASILVGQSVTFTSTVSGGYTPYGYQWYLNGNPVSGATSASWTFTPTASGIYYIHLKVTDSKANTAQSDTARITAATVPVGGYSVPIQVSTKAEPIIPYIALIATLTAIFTKLRPKTKRKR